MCLYLVRVTANWHIVKLLRVCKFVAIKQGTQSTLSQPMKSCLKIIWQMKCQLSSTVYNLGNNIHKLSVELLFAGY